MNSVSTYQTASGVMLFSGMLTASLASLSAASPETQPRIAPIPATYEVRAYPSSYLAPGTYHSASVENSTDLELVGVITDVYSSLLAKQQPMPADIAAVIYQNMEDFFE